MLLIQEYRLTHKMSYTELYDTISYSFPNWEELVATRDKHEIELFVFRFGWTLQDFIKEYAKHRYHA